MENEAKAKTRTADMTEMQHVIKEMIDERMSDVQVVTIFKALDTDGDGSLGFDEFVKAYQVLNPNASMVQLTAMFQEADLDGSGTLDLHEVSFQLINLDSHRVTFSYSTLDYSTPLQFIQLAKIAPLDLLGKQSLFDRDTRGMMQLLPSTEEYFGEMLVKSYNKGVGLMTMSQSQHLAMELYESRIASMQRFVAMTVMFHQMGMRVQTFFEKISFGLLGYRMDRTHSIMRIATTASPVSGADVHVRERMLELHHRYKIQKSIETITRALQKWKQIKDQMRIANLKQRSTVD
jgi:hypothetical protein